MHLLKVEGGAAESQSRQRLGTGGGRDPLSWRPSVRHRGRVRPRTLLTFRSSTLRPSMRYTPPTHTQHTDTHTPHHRRHHHHHTHKHVMGGLPCGSGVPCEHVADEPSMPSPPPPHGRLTIAVDAACQGGVPSDTATHTRAHTRPRTHTHHPHTPTSWEVLWKRRARACQCTADALSAAGRSSSHRPRPTSAASA